MAVIDVVAVVPVRRRLRRPLATARGVVSDASGVAIRLQSRDGSVAEGEAPLLPGADPARRGRVADELRTLAEKLRGMHLEAARELAATASLSPPAAWGLDVALASALARERGVSLATLWSVGAAPLTEVRTNALLVSSPPRILEMETVRRVAEGEHTLKLKVGGGSLQRDVERVAAVRRAAGDDVALRLDANQAWDEAGARRSLYVLARFRPEYVEQPVPATDVEALRRLDRDGPLPVAADESARDPEGVGRVIGTRAASVVVLKPACLGSFEVNRAWVERARAAGLRVVLSSIFDGPLSLRAAVHLAAALRLDDVHGLATGSLLLNPAGAPTPRAGRIRVPQ